ncbi:hypothetical protein Airi02_027230 [Actinoallomurus iriomotensis]|uniref:Uncharacterized protein n=2 Tax=Actinoallomurus iriomotensis TaxID=478107 RepID=A0A9W6S0C5_9ACTN|nr:hypothetical protein Airi02_027230 [Actinoallomurus iriomotensis]
MIQHMLAMLPQHEIAENANGLNTDDLAKWLRAVFGPLFLVIVSIVAIFFLFTREITRFVQFIILAIGIGVIFYVPNIIETTAKAIAKALGVTIT